MPGITFVIFHKYTTDTPITVVERICEGMKSINELQFEIVIVQDGGLRKSEICKYIHDNNLNFLIKEVHYPISSGVSYAILKGVEHAKYSHACIVPGNDQFTSVSFGRIALHSQKYDAVLGFRRKILTARPLPKIVASKILLYGTKFLFFPKAFWIKDFHGLNLVKVSLINQYLTGNEGHGIQISLILPLLFEKKSVLQTRVFLNRNGSLYQRLIKFPKPHDLYQVIACLLKLFIRLRLKIFLDKQKLQISER